MSVVNNRRNPLPLPSQEQLLSHFSYNPETGEMIKLSTGKPIGYLASRGYVVVPFQRKHYKLHRLAWKMFYGEDPGHQLDHINRIRNDNRICNLREVDSYLQAANTNKSAMEGVCRAGLHMYRAQINVLGDKIHLGCYPTKELALAAAYAAKTVRDIVYAKRNQS
jgi:hypothetical protein